jgi:hypothetical protein
MTLELKENEIEALIFALSNQREETYRGSINEVNYRELMEKISEQLLKQI